MELRTVRHFLVLSEELHFGRAAKRLHAAQSALSQQIKQLETQLGVLLFERSTRRVELTEAGRRFRDHAHRIVDAADQAQQEMAALATGRVGRVTIGFVGTATYDVLPRVAHRVRDELPGVDLVVRGEMLNPDLWAGIGDGSLDLALLRPGDHLVGRRLQVVRRERLVAALPDGHPLAEHASIDLSELASEAFVVHPSGDHSTMYGAVLAACLRAGFQPRELIEVRETATLVVSVAAGLGVALVPEPVLSLAVAGTTYVPLAGDETVDLALATRAGNLSTAVGQVARIVAVCSAEGPGKDTSQEGLSHH